MANTNSAIRFDHKEIAVIFSLFIFVALLMFTVGILVGKGLAQAQFAGAAGHHTPAREISEAPPANPANLGTSVSTDRPNEHGAAEASEKEEKHSEHGEKTAEHAAAAPVAASEHAVAKAEAKADAHSAPAADKHAEEADTSSPSANYVAPKTVHKLSDSDEPAEAHAGLKLIPKKPGVIPDDPTKKEAQHVINDPKLAGLFEEAKGPAPKKPTPIEREVTSVDPLAGSSSGKWTVQIGSYPSQKDAEARVADLKKLGFSYAYSSVKTLDESKDTWYRVWLGFYPDTESAKKSGESLQARGEVKNYIVKKTDSRD